MASIHDYKRRFERYLERIKNSKVIPEENKKIILNFKDHMLSEGIGLARIQRYFTDLIKYSRMLNKAFPKASKEDIRRIIGELNQTKLSEETKKSFKIMLRKLYRFIEGIEEKGVYPERVRWFTTHIPQSKRKMPEELLTQEEIKKIIQNCKTLRNKAIMAVLSESGCRIGEIGTLKIKHVTFEKYGARLHVDGKTGPRKILVINSMPYLQQWINQHPGNDDPESFLWIKSDGELLKYTRFASILKQAAKKAGIKKRVHLHLLRHSRATFLAGKMSDSALKHYMGWTQSSKMAGIYIHMNGKETDDTILKINGIKVEEKEEENVMQPKKCIKCNKINEATNRFCNICGMVLDEDEAKRIIEQESERSQADEIMNKLIKDPEIFELIKKKIS